MTAWGFGSSKGIFQFFKIEVFEWSGIANFLGTNASANQVTIGATDQGILNLNTGNITSQVAWGATGGVLNLNGGTLTARDWAIRR